MAAEPRRDPSSLPAFDALIHERARLGIMSALAATAAVPFRGLRDLLQVTDGNLSVHARKLEDAGYVQCEKSFDGRVPRTTYAITPAGRAAFNAYLDHMESLIRHVRHG